MAHGKHRRIRNRRSERSDRHLSARVRQEQRDDRFLLKACPHPGTCTCDADREKNGENT